MAWANKPNAVMRASVVTDAAELEELHQFCIDNPIPRWRWHTDDPPYPSMEQFQFYFDRGNPIITVRDQDGELWMFRINSRNHKDALWAHFRREVDEAHDKWQGEPRGGMSNNSRESLAHSNALTWAMHGSILPRSIPGDGVNPNVKRADQENAARMRARATTLFRTVYGPEHGL